MTNVGINEEKSDKKDELTNQKEIKKENIQDQNILAKFMEERNKNNRISEIFNLKINLNRNSILLSDFKYFNSEIDFQIVIRKKLK